MNRYAELRKRQQEEFNTLPLGFAFGQSQFDEMMRGWGLDPEKDTGKIYSIGAGGYVQKKDADLLHKTWERHDAEMAAAIAEDRVSRIVMNPPFTRFQDIDHIRHAYDLLDEGGILVSVASESPFFRSEKKAVEFRAFLDEARAEVIRLETGAFHESGTEIPVRLVKIRKPQ